MAGTIDTRNVAFRPDTSGVKPDAALTNKRLLGHLTKGWDGSTWAKDAITWRADAPNTLNAAEKQSWEFGFVQIAEAVFCRSFYVGRKREEGVTTLDYFAAPALKQTILLDNGDKSAKPPWFRTPGGTILPNGRIQVFSGDHPGHTTPLTVKNNAVSGVKNFLFHTIQERKFWTMFAAKPPGQPLQYIGHMIWELHYDFELRWKNEKPEIAKNASRLSILTSSASGRPDEGKIKGLLDNPAPPLANTAGDTAILVTESGTATNKIEVANARFRNVPPDFWTQA